MKTEKELLLPFFLASPDRSVYETVVDTIVNLARTGVLVEGALLPGSHVLARQMQVSHISVERCYTHLKELGVLETDKRRGTRFTSKDNLLRLQAHKALSDAILACRQMKLAQGVIKKLFADSLAEHFSEHVRGKARERRRSS